MFNIIFRVVESGYNLGPDGLFYALEKVGYIVFVTHFVCMFHFRLYKLHTGIPRLDVNFCTICLLESQCVHAGTWLHSYVTISNTIFSDCPLTRKQFSLVPGNRTTFNIKLCILSISCDVIWLFRKQLVKPYCEIMCYF